MSTQINVTVDSGGLSDRAKQQQQAARQAQLEKERQQRIKTEGTDQRTAKLKAEGMAPDGSPLFGPGFSQPEVERRPAANRTGGTLFTFIPAAAPTLTDNIKIWPQTSKGLLKPITFAESTPPVDSFGTVVPSSSYFQDNAFNIDASSLSTPNPQGNAFSRAVVSTNLQRLRSSRARKITIELEARACEAISYGTTADANQQLRATVLTGINFSGLIVRASSLAISGSPGQSVPIPLPATNPVSTQSIEITTVNGSIYSSPVAVDAFKLIKLEFTTKEEILLTLDGTPLLINVPLARQTLLENLFTSTSYSITASAYVELGSSNLPLPSAPSVDPALKNLKIRWQE